MATPLLLDLGAPRLLLLAALALTLVAQTCLPNSVPTPHLLDRPVRPRTEPLSTAGLIPAYPAILDRPLFEPTRTAGANGAVMEAPAPPGAFALLGLAVAGRQATASLRGADGLTRTLRLGDLVQGWRLTAVYTDHAVLSHGADSQDLRIGSPPLGQAGAPLSSSMVHP